MKTFLLILRLFGVFPVKEFGISFVYTFILLSAIGVRVLPSMKEKFEIINSVEHRNFAAITFVALIGEIITIITLCCIMYILLFRGNIFHDILHKLHAESHSLEFEQNFKVWLKTLSNISLLVFPLHFLIVSNEIYVWQNVFDMIPSLIVSTFAMIVQAEMMLLILSIRFLFQRINNKIKVSGMC